MPFARIGDAAIHYREAGGGSDVVLLLHAFPLHAGMWSRQIAALSRKYQVIAPDYRGLGKSPPGPAARTEWSPPVASE